MFCRHFAVWVVKLVVDEHKDQAKAKASRYADHACPLVPRLTTPNDKIVIVDLNTLKISIYRESLAAKLL